jgi:hypothetical protein
MPEIQSSYPAIFQIHLLFAQKACIHSNRYQPTPTHAVCMFIKILSNYHKDKRQGPQGFSPAMIKEQFLGWPLSAWF